MNKTTRTTAVVGTTLALVIGGTAAVAAAGPRDWNGDRGMGDGPQMGAMGGMRGGPDMGDRGMGGMRGGPDMGDRGMGDRGMGDRGMGGGMRGLDADVERSERTVQTAEGSTTVRVEQGVVDSAAADSLSFSLGSGETVTVVIDDDTEAVAFEEQEVTSRRGLSRTRLAPTEIEATEIEAGTEVVVRSDAEDDAEFVASRIVVKPAAAEEDVEGEEATEETEDVAETTEDAAATDA